MSPSGWPLVACLLLSPALHEAARQPHIVFIVADDLGWNDVGWHNPDMITPNLDRLARRGVILNSSYVLPVCSPSRNAFMSGYYPIHTGLQHGVIHTQQPSCMPLNLTTLPQRLKRLGYSTHMIGKWHLGYCNWKCTPTFRGFDTFVGFYTGAEHYFNHSRTNRFHNRQISGYDFRFNKSVYWSAKGVYSANVFANRVVEILASHDPKRNPLYLYVPFQSVHSPLEVPSRYKALYRNIKHKRRRIYCRMVTALDEAVGNITHALEKYGFLNNTVIVFTTDNGGPVRIAANNLPLRGAKATLWEGGTKGAGFVYGPSWLKRQGYTHTGLIHAVDWYPTLLKIAGGRPDPKMDGINLWDSISRGTPSKRKEFVYNIDKMRNHGAIRVGDYKLIQGNPGRYNGWYPIPTKNSHNDLMYDCDEDDDDECCCSRKRRRRQKQKYRLFNIAKDPAERFNLVASHPKVLKRLKRRLQHHRRSMVPAITIRNKRYASPLYHGAVWSPGWCHCVKRTVS